MSSGRSTILSSRPHQETVRPVIKEISASFGVLTAHPTFKEWLAGEAARVGDRVLCNNSFLFRHGVKTKKSDLYPLLEIQREGKLPALPTIAAGVALNNDYPLLPKQS